MYYCIVDFSLYRRFLHFIEISILLVGLPRGRVVGVNGVNGVCVCVGVQVFMPRSSCALNYNQINSWLCTQSIRQQN